MTNIFFIIGCITILLEISTAQVLGRYNNGFYGNPANSLAIENAYGPYNPNLAYPANALAYDGIANGIYGPANPLAYDGFANGIYGPANALAYDGYANGVYGLGNPFDNIYGPTNALAYDGFANGIYGPANPLAYDGIANGIYGPASPLAFDNIGCGLTLAGLSASNGRGFSVRSSSPIGVTGVSVESENMLIEGPLLVNGQLPFLGTVGLEGALPVAGNGAVLYGCGNGNVAILSEEFPSPAVAPGYGYNALPTSGYGPAVAGSLGCNRGPYGGLY